MPPAPYAPGKSTSKQAKRAEYLAAGGPLCYDAAVAGLVAPLVDWSRASLS